MKDRIVNNRTVIKIGLCLVAVVFFVGVSYALWQQTKVQQNKNIIATGCFNVDLEEENPINLANSYPMPLSDGMNSIPYTFTIKNTCNSTSNYIINLETMSATTYLNSSIRVAIGEDSKLYSNYPLADKYFESSKESRTLVKGELNGKDSATYYLRLWIDEDAPVTENGKFFESKIIVTTMPKNSNINANGIAAKVSIGDYISMTPTIDSFDITSTMSKCTNACETKGNTQRLQPKELTLWRVIKKNNDGSIDIVSEYVSSNTIEINGASAYKEYINIMNTIALQYTNEKYVQSTRHMGYDGNQSDILKNVSALEVTQAPWKENTSNNDNESLGGGDIGYLTDTELVKQAIGNLAATSPDGNQKLYFLASRQFVYSNSDSWSFGFRRVLKDGSVDFHATYAYVTGTKQDYNPAYAIRPILTIKKDVEIASGNGKSNDTPYVLK